MTVVAVVDPYDAGVLLAPELRARGADVVLVRGALVKPGEEFLETVRHDGDLAGTSALLRELGVSYVVPGSEWGVQLADQLSEALGIPSNGTRLSAARRDKYRMIETVGVAGLRVPAQFSSATLEPLVQWIEVHGQWPAILKPLHAAGADGVRFCSDAAEAAAAFRELIGATNVMAQVNERVLAQEFVDGDEYVVDTVSWNGVHRVAGFWRYGKPKPSYATVGLFHTKELLPPDGPLQRQLFDYVRGVLDALEIRFGPAHCEVKVGRDGPVLIELGARLHGGPKAHQMCRAATGTSQLDQTVALYVAPTSEGLTPGPAQPRAQPRSEDLTPGPAQRQRDYLTLGSTQPLSEGAASKPAQPSQLASEGLTPRPAQPWSERQAPRHSQPWSEGAAPRLAHPPHPSQPMSEGLTPRSAQPSSEDPALQLSQPQNEGVTLGPAQPQSEGLTPRPAKTAIMVLLRPEHPGRPNPPAVAQLERLLSLHELTWNAPGSAVAGLVVLMHELRSVVEHDLSVIRDLENHGLFD